MATNISNSNNNTIIIKQSKKIKKEVCDYGTLSRYSLDKLKILCRKKGYKVTGNKTQLINRILGIEDNRVKLFKLKMIKLREFCNKKDLSSKGSKRKLVNRIMDYESDYDSDDSEEESIVEGNFSNIFSNLTINNNLGNNYNSNTIFQDCIRDHSKYYL